MQKYTRLFVDKISSDFDPSKDFVLGPWCLKDSFTLNKINEFSAKGVFLKNKTADTMKAYKCCEDQHARIVQKVAKYVQSINKNKYSLDFYKDYISHWLIEFIHYTHFSKRLINECIIKFNDYNLELILLHKPKKIIFNNYNDFAFKRTEKLDFFSSFLLFLLIENKPKRWKISYYNIKETNNDNREIFENSNNYFLKFGNFLRRCLAPRVKTVYGLNFFEKIFISLVLLFKKPIREKTFRKNYYSNIDQNYIEPPISDNNLFQLIKKLLPINYKEIYKKKEKFTNCDGKIMLCSAPSLYNDISDEKFDLLMFKEKKGKIYSVQHGACYGDLFYRLSPMEYGFDKFISWGHKKHQNYDIDFQPLPSPQFKINYKENSSQNILFVSTGTYYFVPKYVDMFSFDDTISRVNDTISFLDELDVKFLEKIKYKNLNRGHFSEKEILKEKFKSLQFINTIPEKNINKSKLIVQNHNGTPFYKSLAANAPTICFWRKDCWALTDKALELHDNLHNAGILFYNPKLAAQKLKEVWPNITDWWQSGKVQDARRKFCDEFANKDDKWFSVWIKYLWGTR